MKNKITRFLATADLNDLMLIDMACALVYILGFMYTGYLFLGKGEILLGGLTAIVSLIALSISTTISNIAFYRTMNELRKGR